MYAQVCTERDSHGRIVEAAWTLRLGALGAGRGARRLEVGMNLDVSSGPIPGLFRLVSVNN